MTLHSSKKEGSSFPQLIGSRAQVWHGTAYKTTGGLTKGDLMMSHGRVVSRKKHFTAKKEKRLEKAGYFAKKGSFGFIKKTLKSRRRGRKMRGGLGDSLNGDDDNIDSPDGSIDPTTNLSNDNMDPTTSMVTGGRRKRRTRRRLRGGKVLPLSPSAFEKH
jgi:hypothetical protein